jgi:XTP/dITP diphosphohydrolase
VKRLVIASHNAGKVRELRALLAGMDIGVLGLDELPDIGELSEPFDTFADNARHKALQVSHHSGLPALADDSGLVVDALDGRPGVHSSRYGQTDAERIRRLMAELADVAADSRTAHFVCVLALAHQGQILGVWEASTKGTIIAEPRGVEGFGYDPVFFYPPLGRTFAQMAPEQKNRVSHRGRALRAMRDRLPELLSRL